MTTTWTLAKVRRRQGLETLVRLEPQVCFVSFLFLCIFSYLGFNDDMWPVSATYDLLRPPTTCFSIPTIRFRYPPPVFDSHHSFSISATHFSIPTTRFWYPPPVFNTHLFSIPNTCSSSRYPPPISQWTHRLGPDDPRYVLMYSYFSLTKQILISTTCSMGTTRGDDYDERDA